MQHDPLSNPASLISPFPPNNYQKLVGKYGIHSQAPAGFLDSRVEPIVSSDLVSIATKAALVTHPIPPDFSLARHIDTIGHLGLCLCVSETSLDAGWQVSKALVGAV
jgi:hypothetical protein